MGMQVSKTTVNYGVPIWQTDNLQTAQGGFTLDTTGLTDGDTIKAGSAFTFDETTRKAKKQTVSGDGSTTPYSSDAKGLLYEDIIVADSTDVAIVIMGTVYENRIPELDADADKKAAIKAALPRITFSQSY